MLSGAIDITLLDDSFNVIEEQLSRRSAEEAQGFFNPGTPCGGVFATGENYITGPAPTQRCNECQQRITATPDDGEVHLHLFTRLGFEPNDGFSSLSFQRQQEASED